MREYVTFLRSCPSSLDLPDPINILLPLVGKQPDVDYSEHLTVDCYIIACSYRRCWNEAWVKVSERRSKALYIDTQPVSSSSRPPSPLHALLPSHHYSRTHTLLHHTNLHHSFVLTQHRHHSIFKHVFSSLQDLLVRLRRYAFSRLLVVFSCIQEDALSRFKVVLFCFEDVCRQV
jgi:hypothetical protein